MRRFGDLLLGLGLVVGIGAIVGYELDVMPALPPAVLKLVLYKLIFVGGVGLLVAGALIRRGWRANSKLWTWIQSRTEQAATKMACRVRSRSHPRAT